MFNYKIIENVQIYNHAYIPNFIKISQHVSNEYDKTDIIP